ncbi:MAG TPA: ABC transporter permease [Clostridia bacterium]|nr:ABC transporter permease [Clostridia bacterium]
MKSYISAFRVRFLNGLQYRAAALGGLTTQFFWGVMAIFIYKAFYESGGQPQTISFSELTTYLWLQQAFLALLMLYDWDYELFDMITSGNISYELCRPCNLYWFWYVKLLSKRLASATLRFSPIIIIAFLLPATYRLSLPYSPVSFLLFIITMLLGLLLLVAISMLIYISVFKTMSPVGSMAFVGLTGEFFSGMIIPVPLMPEWLQRVCYIMPFRWTADLPLRIYSGNIRIDQGLVSIGVQLLWILILISVGSIMMKRITKRVVVQGG